MSLLPVHKLPPFDPERTETVFCQECQTWFTPAPGWWCPNPDCGARAAYAVQLDVCGRCNEVQPHRRDGHELLTLCRCDETAEQTARRLARWEALAAEESAEGQPRAPRPKPRAKFPEDSPTRDWWFPLADLLPPNLAEGEVLERVQALRETFTLDSVEAAVRRVLERIKIKGTRVGSPSYLQTALENELARSGQKHKAA